MSTNLQALFDPTNPAVRRQGLTGLLGEPDPVRRLERALLDLLDLDDPALLEALAHGLAPHASDPAARRILEAVSRVPSVGPARAAALGALRGDPLPALAAPADPATPAATATPVAPAPPPAPAAPAAAAPATPPAPPAPAPAAAAGDPALAAVERAATTPTPEALDDAELALIEIDPDALSPEVTEALATRLTAAAGAHADAETQSRLERLARELREALA